MAWRGKARKGGRSGGMPGQWHGRAWHGAARLGTARLGEAGQGKKGGKMKWLRFRLKGISPLLMHNPQSMKRGGGGRLGKKEIPEPEVEAAAARYLLPDGNFYIPAVAVRNSLLSGAKGYRIGRVPAASLLAGAVLLEEVAFPLLDDQGKAIKGDNYRVDIRPVVVQRQGRVMRARARIDPPWYIEGAFPFNPDLVGLEAIKQALSNAGQVVGLLDYRPECSGWFGRFEVESISVE